MSGLLACICWGIENNCTRKLSSKNPLQIVMVKGTFSGTGSIIIGAWLSSQDEPLKDTFARYITRSQSF